MARRFKVADFQKAVIIAMADVSIDADKHPIEPMYGCGLEDFEPVEVTLEQVARHIRWQASYMDGTWDWNEIDNIKHIAKNKFLLEGE